MNTHHARRSTVREKAMIVLNLTAQMDDAAKREDYVTARRVALAAKKECQSIATQARAAQKRKCTHTNLDAGHRSIRHWHNMRTITVHYNCVDCGKTSIKTDVIERINTTDPTA